MAFWMLGDMLAEADSHCQDPAGDHIKHINILACCARLSVCEMSYDCDEFEPDSELDRKISKPEIRYHKHNIWEHLGKRRAYIHSY